MRLRVLVKDGTARLKAGTSKKTGKPYAMNVQSVWVDLGKPFPSELQVTLSDGAAPFPVGEYTLGIDSLHVTGFGDLAIDVRKMQPVVAGAQAKAS